MIPKAVDVKAAAASRPVLKNRTSETVGLPADAAFAVLAETENGRVFVGSYEGRSAWERHSKGDELVQIVDGQATLTMMLDGEAVELEMQAGMITVVPRNRWHRIDAPDGVTVMTMTPQPTDYATGDDPPFEVKE